MPQPPEEQPKPDRATILAATEAFLNKCLNRGIRPNTLAKYRTFTNQLSAWASEVGYIYVDQFSVTDMDKFYASWKDGIRARAKKVERLKHSFGSASSASGSRKMSSKTFRHLKGHQSPIPRHPLWTNIKRLYSACDQVKRTPRRDWDGDDIKDFIDLSLYTGLRISDVVMFNIAERLHGHPGDEPVERDLVLPLGERRGHRV
jgi:integrase